MKTRLTDVEIERLRLEDWLEMVQALQSFSQKLEKKDSSKKSFKLSLENLKLSIDQLRQKWDDLKLGDNYPADIFEDDIYQSPYEDLDFAMEMYEESAIEEMVGIFLERTLNLHSITRNNSI